MYGGGADISCFPTVRLRMATNLSLTGTGIGLLRRRVCLTELPTAYLYRFPQGPYIWLRHWYCSANVVSSGIMAFNLIFCLNSALHVGLPAAVSSKKKQKRNSLSTVAASRRGHECIGHVCGEEGSDGPGSGGGRGGTCSRNGSQQDKPIHRYNPFHMPPANRFPRVQPLAETPQAHPGLVDLSRVAATPLKSHLKSGMGSLSTFRHLVLQSIFRDPRKAGAAACGCPRFSWHGQSRRHSPAASMC